MIRRLVICTLFLVLAMGSALAQQDVVLSVVPSAESVNAGELVYVEISVDSSVNVYAAQYFLGFDTSAFEVFSQEQGEYLSSDGSSTSVIANAYDNTKGYVTYGETRTGTTTGVSEKGVLATITLKVKDDAPTGDYVLHLYDVVVADPTASPIQNVSTVPATVHVNGTAAAQPQSTAAISKATTPAQTVPTETTTSAPTGTETPSKPAQTTTEQTSKPSPTPVLPPKTFAPSAVLTALALLGAALIIKRR